MKNLSVEIDGKVIDRTCENCCYGGYDEEGFWCDMLETEILRPYTDLCDCHKLKLEVENFE